MLIPQERNRLLQIAREAIQNHLLSQPQISLKDPPVDLQKKGGAFVTLHREGKLRGCIGRLISPDPLWLTIRDMAIEAAFSDPRFPPVSADEFEDLQIEISVLSPMEEIENLEDINIGEHGLYVILGSRKGVLLPQVAPQFDWNREEFLSYTCRKAGLALNAWMEEKDLQIFRFSAEIFEED